MSRTEPATGEPSGKATRRIKWLAVAIAVAIALYTGGWFYLASRIDRAAGEAIASAARDGTEILCEGRDVRGYPFRLGLHCAGTGVATPDGISAAAGAFRSAAQVYQPNFVISELDGPARVETPDGAVAADWDIARASTRFGTEGLTRGTVEIADVSFETAGGGAPLAGRIDRVVASTRPNGADLDAALSVDALDLEPVAGRDAPPASLSVDATVSGAASLLSGGGGVESLRGRTLTLRPSQLALTGGRR